MEYVIGIDVGTNSVRGALVDKTGKICKIKTEEITTWNPKPDFYQQSSTEIWHACCEVIKKLTRSITPERVKGLGFDATCSLAVCDADGNSISVDPNGDDNQNIILWMDHRAKTETNIINEIQRSILGYQGENVSIEKSIPKLLWLKRSLPVCWKKAAHYFLLPDFLTWRATGRNSRSLSSVVCGFNYKSSPDNNLGWDKTYFDAIGLQELAENDFEKIGTKIISPGKFCGTLNTKTAFETGLPNGTPVAAALIDALSGSLGVLGCHSEFSPTNFTSRLALVGGTSTCHMYQTEEPIFIPGVWGPYFNVLMPDLWLLVGGQSVSGKLIDHVIDNHPAVHSIREKHPHVTITEYLNSILHKISKNRPFDELTENMHVYPDFHGNRTPLADENLRGMVLGLTLENDENNLALLYLATIQALVYSTKHTIEELQRHSTSTKIESVLICGGLGKNTIFVQSHANALGLRVLLPEEAESVLLGSAMLAASASDFYPDLKTTVLSMAGSTKMVDAEPSVRRYHDKKYKVYHELLRCQIKSRQLMKSL